MKKISIVTPCFNEDENVKELYRRISEAIKVFSGKYIFEILFIDNASTDKTVSHLREIASLDSTVKLIINTRNFGHIRSPYWGIIQSSGDATIYLASDLQDPPEYIPEFIRFWEKGWKVVLAVKPSSKTNRIFHACRQLYYRFLDVISDVEIVKDSTGFGIYDKVVLDNIRSINDPYPFLRGLISELGFPIKQIVFNQPARLRGISKNNFYSLYDIAMLGIVSHSIVPIRISSFIGFFMAAVSFFIAIAYFILKIIYWEKFPLGLAPLVIGVFLMFGILFVFIGLIGEYVGAILTYVKRRPIVVERERVNF